MQRGAAFHKFFFTFLWKFERPGIYRVYSGISNQQLPFQQVKFFKTFSRPIAGTEASVLADYRRSGDPELLGGLFQPYMDFVFAICFKYLKDEAESKDAVMQIFEKLVTELKTHEVTHFKSWLHTVTRNHCLMQLRSAPVTTGLADLPGEVSADYGGEPWGEDLKELRLAWLEKCLDTLREEQRVAIDLFYFREMCYRDIADRTGMEQGRVKSCIQNGKRNLKLCIEKNGREQTN